MEPAKIQTVESMFIESVSLWIGSHALCVKQPASELPRREELDSVSRTGYEHREI